MSLKSGGIRGGQLYALSHSLIYISNIGYPRILGVESQPSCCQKYNGAEICRRKWKKAKRCLISHVLADKHSTQHSTMAPYALKRSSTEFKPNVEYHLRIYCQDSAQAVEYDLNFTQKVRTKPINAPA